MTLLPLFGTALVFAQSSKQYMKAGDEFLRKMSFDDAIEQFTRAIELDPDDDKAYIQRALAYMQLNDFEKASLDFDRALVFNEKDGELYFLSGNSYYLLGNSEIALDRLSKAISYKNNFQEAFQVRSLVLMELRRYQEALDDCRKSLRIKEDEKGFYNLAMVYEKLEMYPEAEEAFRLSIDENPRVMETHFGLASLLYITADYSEAYASISQVLQLDPDNLDGRDLS